MRLPAVVAAASHCRAHVSRARFFPQISNAALVYAAGVAIAHDHLRLALDAETSAWR